MIDVRPVEHNIDEVLVACNLNVVPFSHRLHCILGGLHQIIKCTGIIVTGGLTIENLNLDAVISHVPRRQWLQGKCPHEDATVGVRTDLEVQRQNEVAPGPFVGHHVGVTSVWANTFIVQRLVTALPFAGHPVFHRLSVKQQDPAAVIRGSQPADHRGEHHHDQPSNDPFVPHDTFSLLLFRLLITLCSYQRELAQNDCYQG